MQSLHHAVASAAPLSDHRWASAQTLSEYVDAATSNRELFRSILAAAHLSPQQAMRAQAISCERRVLILLEDWCVDAMHAASAMLRFVETNTLLSLRVLSRDANPDVMDAHRVGTARSIPVVMAFDHDGRECGWWGPRPSPLQMWIEHEMQYVEQPARSQYVRDWYAKDDGVTTQAELLTLLELG